MDRRNWITAITATLTGWLGYKTAEAPAAPQQTKCLAGCNPLCRDLARKLAPGRLVKRLDIAIPVDEVATALVEVFIAPEDLPLIEQIANSADLFAVGTIPRPRPDDPRFVELFSMGERKMRYRLASHYSVEEKS